MSVPDNQTQTCAIYDSGMAERVAGTDPFRAGGAKLDIEMLRLDADLPETSGPEEMLAILDGQARLVCPEESHELTAGQGILIPAGTPHRLEVRGTALVYRVTAK